MASLSSEMIASMLSARFSSARSASASPGACNSAIEIEMITSKKTMKLSAPYHIPGKSKGFYEFLEWQGEPMCTHRLHGSIVFPFRSIWSIEDKDGNNREGQEAA